jgi:hypothetical protein
MEFNDIRIQRNQCLEELKLINRPKLVINKTAKYSTIDLAEPDSFLFKRKYKETIYGE